MPGMRNIRAASKLWQHFISDKNLLYKEETVPIRWKKLRRTGIFPGKMP